MIHKGTVCSYFIYSKVYINYKFIFQNIDLNFYVYISWSFKLHYVYHRMEAEKGCKMQGVVHISNNLPYTIETLCAL